MRKAQQLIDLNDLKIEIFCGFPQPVWMSYGLKRSLDGKPKSMSLYNWVYPQFYYITENENVEESHKRTNKMWNEYSIWIKQCKSQIQYVIKFSTSEKVMARAFNSKHFESCGSVGGCNKHRAIEVIADPNKSVCYVEDRAGNILARTILKYNEEDKSIGFYIVYTNSHIITRSSIDDELKKRNLIPIGSTTF